MKFAEHVAHITYLNNPHNIFFNKLESKKLVGKTVCRREDHIKRKLKNDTKWLNYRAVPSHSSMKIGNKTVHNSAIELEKSYLHL